jgi:hypothetical protein
VSYLAGANVMRLLYSRFLGLRAFSTDLNTLAYFVLPLNLLANYTLVFTGTQLFLDVFVVLYLTPADDAFTLAAMGLALNTLLAALQLFKHLTTTRAFPDKNIGDAAGV